MVGACLRADGSLAYDVQKKKNTIAGGSQIAPVMAGAEKIKLRVLPTD